MRASEMAARFGGETELSIILCRGAGFCNLNFSEPDVIEEWKNKMLCTAHEEVKYIMNIFINMYI